MRALRVMRSGGEVGSTGTSTTCEANVWGVAKLAPEGSAPRRRAMLSEPGGKTAGATVKPPSMWGARTQLSRTTFSSWDWKSPLGSGSGI